jgi:response regulator of citrate/malate metabolism
MEMEDYIKSKVQSQTTTKLSIPGNRKYLIVEDDLTLQPIWEHIIKLVDPNSIIRWSKSEEGAEKLINDRIKMSNPFNFVIADIMLSGEKNGIELWKKYQSIGMKFLFTSGISEKQFVKILESEGINRPFFVRKPIHIPNCIQTLKAMLS